MTKRRVVQATQALQPGHREGSSTTVSFRFFHLYLKVPIVLLALIEGSLFVYAPYLAAALRFGSAATERATPTGNLLPTALLFAFFAVMALFAMGLYTIRQRSGTAGTVLRVVAGLIVAAALSALAYYVVPNIEIGRGMLALTTVIGIASCTRRAAACSSTSWTRTCSSAGSSSTAPVDARRACSSCAAGRTSAASGWSASSQPRATT